MIWFLEKDSDLLICEIRHTEDEEAYEFEVASPEGPRTERFANPTDLIACYLRAQSQLRAQGWRPRSGDVRVLAE